MHVPRPERRSGRGRGVGPAGGPDVFTVIAHPLRRALLDLLRATPEEEQPVKRLAAPFGVSRPAVSQHLAVLLGAGLVRERRVGRERRYRLEAARLREAHDWVGSYEPFWEEKLDALGRLLDETVPPEPPGGRAARGGEAPPGGAGGAGRAGGPGEEGPEETR